MSGRETGGAGGGRGRGEYLSVGIWARRGGSRVDICRWEGDGAPKNERRGCGKEGRRTKSRRDGGREVGRKEIAGRRRVGNFSLTVHTGALTDTRTHAADTCCSSRCRGTLQVTHTEEEVEGQPEGRKKYTFYPSTLKRNSATTEETRAALHRNSNSCFMSRETRATQTDLEDSKESVFCEP